MNCCLEPGLAWLLGWAAWRAALLQEVGEERRSRGARRGAFSSP